MALHTLMFGWEYPPHHSGGLGVACQGLVRGLLHHGVAVTLVLPTGNVEDEVDVRSTDTPGCKFLRVKSNLQPYEGSAEYRTRIALKGLPRERSELYGPDLGDAVERFTQAAVDMTEDLKPDVVHCHDWMTYGAGIRASRYHQVPLVAHMHATEFDRTDFHPNPWIAEREREGLLAADRVIAVSGYTKNLLMEHYGIAANKIEIVHNGHDTLSAIRADTLTSQYGQHDHPLVLFLGRLTVQKNPWQFLEVARRVHAFDPNVQFVVAGDGPLLPELIDRTCALGMEEHILFTGKLRQEEVRSLFARADCFVMPSLSEPFGLVALEAVAHRTPVILSKQSGAAEVIDHAFKVDYWDAEKMADCILTILREPPLAEQLRDEAPNVLRTLSWRHQASRVEGIYKHLLSL